MHLPNSYIHLCLDHNTTSGSLNHSQLKKPPTKMPWHEISPSNPIALTNSISQGPAYILFFASGSPPWCSDCRDAQPILEKVFAGVDVEVQVVRMGEKVEWKKTEAEGNKWREFGVREIPSLVKFVDVSSSWF
jgi:thioredoxin-like negative regulator of GroEL